MPAAAEETWQRRHGDCNKDRVAPGSAAQTGPEAEAVLANNSGADNARTIGGPARPCSTTDSCASMPGEVTLIEIDAGYRRQAH